MPCPPNARIPRRYKHTPTQVSAIDETRKVKVRGSFLGEINPAQSNKISWILPNRRDLPFLDFSSIELVGEIQVSAESDGVGEDYDYLQPSVGGDYTGVNLIVDRMQTFIGSSLLDESLNQKLLSSMNIGLKTNPIWRLTQEPYENAGKALTGDTAATWRKFRMRLAYRNAELYGSTSEVLLSQDFIIPVSIAPKIQLDLFFSPPEQIVSVNPAAIGTITNVTYKLRNLELDCLYLDSKVLRQQLASPIPWSVTWDAHLYSEQAIPAGTSGKISLNLPSSYQQLSHVMTIFQKNNDQNDTTVANRIINASDELTEIQSANCRVNGINRYLEHLHAVDVYREIIRLHPSAEFSDFINTDVATLNSTSNYLLMLCGKDYPDPSLLSGINSATSTGSVIVEVTYASALTSNHSARSFLSYARNLAIQSNGNSSLTF